MRAARTPPDPAPMTIRSKSVAMACGSHKKRPRTRRGRNGGQARCSEVQAFGLELGADLGDELGAKVVGINLHDLAHGLVHVKGGTGELLAGRGRIEVDDLL